MSRLIDKERKGKEQARKKKGNTRCSEKRKKKHRGRKETARTERREERKLKEGNNKAARASWREDFSTYPDETYYQGDERNAANRRSHNHWRSH